MKSVCYDGWLQYTVPYTLIIIKWSFQVTYGWSFFVFEEVFILYVYNGNSIPITLMRLLECCVLHWLLPFFSKLHEKNEKERERARWRQAAVVVDLCCCNKKVRWSREWKKERKNGVGCNKNSKFFGRLLRCVFPSLCGWMERLLIKWNYVSLEKGIVMSLEEQY